MIRQFFYVSRSLASPLDIEAIVERARHHNAQRGVTGCLLFTGGHFAQLLEGAKQSLEQTIQAIRLDSRHEAMTCILEETRPARRCDGWDMAFVEAPGADDLIHELLANPGAITAERGQRLLRLMFDPLTDRPR